MDGEERCFHFCCNAGLFAQVRQVSRETIAEVDCGRGPAQQGSTCRKPRLRVQVRMSCAGADQGCESPGRLLKQRELSCRAAKRTGYVDGVADACARAKQRLLSPDRADDNDVCCKDRSRCVDGSLRGVSTRKHYPMLAGEGQQASHKAACPGACELRWQRKGQKSRNRPGPHGCDIAQTARQAPVAGGFRGVPVAAEVYLLEEQVGGDDELVTAPRAQDGAIIADTEPDGGASAARAARDRSTARLSSFAQRGNKRSLAHSANRGRTKPFSLHLDSDGAIETEAMRTAYGFERRQG